MTATATRGAIIAGKYRLLERVGTGGMSEVHRAETLDGGRIVALKLLLPHRSEDPLLGARLVHEAEAVARIKHPGIVELLDVGDSDAGPFMAMEFLNGQSAGRIAFERGKFPLDAALATLIPVLAALGAAHATGVVHRDLKPGNVFIALSPDNELTVKLLDFGIAKTLFPSGPTPRTSTGVVMGTPDYLSPEQANGEASIDGRSDLFAAGVVLFELLTGVRPFHAPTAVATAYRIAHARTPILRDYGGPADPTLQAILERALAKRPEERYATATELAHELQTLAKPEREARRALHEFVRPERFERARETAKSAERSIVISTAPPPDTPSQVRTSRPPSTPLSFRPSPNDGASSKRHARGVVLRTIDAYVKHVFGKEMRARAIGELPRDAALEFEYATLQPIVLYDLAIVTAYLAAVTRESGRGNPSWARSAGAAAVTGELGQLLRGALRPGDPAVVLRRILPVCSKLFDFGSWDLEVNDPVTTVTANDFEPVSTALRMWLVGVLEGSLSVAGTRARATISRGDMSFSPQLVVDVVPG
jgi:serine/threonine protein kinase